jgi:hypothetical protein
MLRVMGLVICVLVSSCFATLVHAMDFTISRDGNYEGVVAKGPIVVGDAERLRPLLETIKRTELGNKFLSLDSPGGSVEAAYRIAAVMDEIGGVGAFVEKGASCASACASIVWIAGKIHVVLPGGRVGLHACYNGKTKIINELCNDRIAQFALEHGTAHGSVFTFMQVIPPDGMLWFDSGLADCVGLSKWREGHEPPGYNQCIHDAIRRR